MPTDHLPMEVSWRMKAGFCGHRSTFPMLLVDIVENSATREPDYYIAIDSEPPMAIMIFNAKVAL